MTLNGALLDLYHKDPLRGGTWTDETKKRIEEKCSIPRGQHEETSAPTMLDSEGYSRTLQELHQELKDATKLGLRSYENLLAMSLTAKHWTPMDTTSNVDKDNWTEDEIIFRA